MKRRATKEQMDRAEELIRKTIERCDRKRFAKIWYVYRSHIQLGLSVIGNRKIKKIPAPRWETKGKGVFFVTVPLFSTKSTYI